MYLQVFLTGLVMKGSIEEFFTPIMGFKLVVLGLISIIAVYTLPRAPYWLGDILKRVKLFSFDEKVKKGVSNVIRWVIYLLTLYLALLIVGFTRVHMNPLFQLVLLYFGIKVTIAVLKPSVKGLDNEISDLDISDDGILMRLLVGSVYIIGLFIALSIIGLKGAITTALAGAGILGIVIGFGAKDIVANTLSGVFIAIDKPFRIGDVVEIEGEVGTVSNIGIRTTAVKKFDNKVVTVPNSTLASNPVTNYTAHNLRRISIEIGIDYGSNLEKAMKALKEALSSLDEVSDKKDQDILVTEFADSSIVLQGRFWVEHHKESVAKVGSLAKEAVLKKFREEGIDIPFPHRVIIEK